MAFHPTMRATFRCWAPGSPEEVEARLEHAVRRGDFDGDIRPGRFELQRPVPSTRNSWRPRLKGTLTEAGEGVVIDVSIGVHPMVFAFTAIHGVFFLGLTWLIGAAAFSWEVPGATEALAAAVDAQATGDDVDSMQVLSDPEDPGAATGAPWSFKARARVDEVQFTVFGASAYGGLVKARRLRLTLGPHGITVDPNGVPPIDVPWGQLQACAVEGDALTLERSGAPSIEIGAGAHDARDLVWMAAFITARARDRRSTATTDAARAKLRLVKGRIPET